MLEQRAKVHYGSNEEVDLDRFYLYYTIKISEKAKASHTRPHPTGCRKVREIGAGVE